MTPSIRRAIPLVKARGIIQELSIREPDEIDIEAIAAHYGAFVRIADLKGADGNIVISNGQAVISVSRAVESEGHRRSVIAHELGHFFLHPKARQIDEVDAKQMYNYGESQEIEELEANLFAAELLMPDKMFTPRIEDQIPSFDLIEKLCGDFKTPLTSTAVQFVQYTREECALISSANRHRSWFIRSPQFSFKIEEDDYVHGYACASEVGPKRKRCRADDVPAYAWLQGFKGNYDAVVTEDAWFFSTLNRTLSLVWVVEAI